MSLKPGGHPQHTHSHTNSTDPALDLATWRLLVTSTTGVSRSYGPEHQIPRGRCAREKQGTEDRNADSIAVLTVKEEIYSNINRGF